MWGSGFVWNDRELCLVRIYCLVTAGRMDLDRAVQEALHKSVDGTYWYCNDPARIPAEELQRLREHAQALIDAKGRFNRARQERMAL